ncbi:NUDIX hydrolase [Vibrio sp. SCSIO 43136]|uniref:NUDIX hydrolase n=1 Tax=Vibrio sp. SCSIO 43136 TaxID=2819101 RepID=UPI002076350C|nr:NUDIX hydrolase [Vibrio sp. SCSIO 43136]USD66916.1 NUDIX hydrolase [Vibrio sp. SCSIO 43136]
MTDLAMAVVVHDGKVLIQKRFRHSLGMVFEFPGGSVDEGEFPIVAASRELFEETGLTDLPALGRHSYKNQLGGDIEFTIFQLVEGQTPQAVDPERQQTFYWYTLQQIPRQDLFPADLEFIDSQLSHYLDLSTLTNIE